MKALIVLTLLYHVFAQKDWLPRRNGRIVGGVSVDISDYSYQVSLEYKGKHFCGGSIITPNTILTAAHCLELADLSLLSIRVGSSVRESGGEVYEGTSISIHPNYSRYAIDYDIAILKLSYTICPEHGHPIPLPASDAVPAEKSIAIVTGWGTTAEGGALPSHLQMVKLPVINQETCRYAYRDFELKVTDRMLCAGYLGVGGKGSCNGDSGGPLVVDGTLYGVVSWGAGCANPKYPSVFANVVNLKDWIKENIGE